MIGDINTRDYPWSDESCESEAEDFVKWCRVMDDMLVMDDHDAEDQFLRKEWEAMSLRIKARLYAITVSDIECSLEARLTSCADG